jgi:hypothetical protein
VDDLPLSDRDFEGCLLESDGNSLFITSSVIHPEDPGPEFPEKAQLLNIATRAFGRAYVCCIEKYFEKIAEREQITWADRWPELVALDGLRSAFLAVDDLGGLEAARDAYYRWIEDSEEGNPGLVISAEILARRLGATVTQPTGKVEWDQDDLFHPFMVNLRDLESYLQGRRRAATQREPKEGWLEILRSVRSLHDRFDNVVEKIVDVHQQSELIWERVRESSAKSPEDQKAEVRGRLRDLLGAAWEHLDEGSQDDLADAEGVHGRMQDAELWLAGRGDRLREGRGARAEYHC